MAGEVTIAGELAHAAIEAATAVAPVALIVIVYHVIDRRSRHRLPHVGVGLAIAYLGLVAFLAGVHLAFVPTGELVAAGIAEWQRWVLVPTGFGLGLVATLAEPAVRVMRIQVEDVSAGTIDGRLLIGTIGVGVGLVVALAMLRVIVDFPLWWILLPGYLLAFTLALRADRRFVGMAFDSGGVATGPMAVTFILSLAVGAASQLPGRDAAVVGFGMVALIALAPIVTVLTLGVAYRRAEESAQREAEGRRSGFAAARKEQQ
jgi:hypothetical protein